MVLDDMTKEVIESILDDMLEDADAPRELIQGLKKELEKGKI